MLPAFLAFCLALPAYVFAGEAPSNEDKPENPFSKLKAYGETYERDCPMCGWNWKKKCSNDKPFSGKILDPETGESTYNPDRDFTGTFEPGTKCPMCNGKGKVVERIDWAEGAVLTVGVGIGQQLTPKGTEDKSIARQRLLAKLAANRRALNNALKILSGIRLADNKAPARNFIAHINAVVKGHESEELKKSNGINRVYYIARMKVPLWGVKGLTAGLIGEYRKSYKIKYGLKMIEKVKIKKETDTDTYIVLDMRGTKHKPVLLPRIEKEDGTVLVDVTTVHEDSVKENGMCKYFVEEEGKSFEEIKKDLEQSLIPKTGKKKIRFAYVRPIGPGTLCCAMPGPLAAQPKRKRRKLRKLVFKAKGDDTGKNAKIVVSAEDAKKIAEADGEDDAVKKGNIIVITDTRIAGKEGFLGKKRNWKYAKR
jgi:hypothetical protein